MASSVHIFTTSLSFINFGHMEDTGFFPKLQMKISDISERLIPQRFILSGSTNIPWSDFSVCYMHQVAVK